MAGSSANATASVSSATDGGRGDSSSSGNENAYCFKWSNYQHHLSEVVRELLAEESMVDVTLYAAGERISVHRLVLSACSTMFQDILNQVNDEHPTIILSDIDPQDVKSIVEFCYNGEVRIPVENINHLLAAAHSLKICGLMDIDGLDESESNDRDGVEETFIIQDISSVDDDDIEILEKINSEKNKDQQKRKSSTDDMENKEKKRRKSVCKREYSEEQLSAAIADIRAGCTLLDASVRNSIPRSTLYMRIKALGIPLNPSRNDYSLEDMKAAIRAVVAGSSLQAAADCYGIPKTVLWRRIQREGCDTSKRETRKNYGSERREAAIKALERGESLTKVANEYKIPKTTLFRDKVRLVDEGKLPSTVWRKRKFEGEEEKRTRLEEAVAACKDGKMSQAAASQTYQIPKTTIWRRLQKENSKLISTSIKKEISSSDSKESSPIKTDIKKSEELNEADFETFCPEDSEMSITYINEENITEDPVIILATGSVDDLNLPNKQPLVVIQDGSNDNFISCGLDLDENSS